MSTPELSAQSVRDALQALSDSYTREYDIGDDDVQRYAIDTATDAIILSDEGLMLAVMDMDANEGIDERLINEIMRYGKLHDNFRQLREHPPEKYADDAEQAESHAIACLRIDYAIRSFRVGYPERLGASGDGYYTSKDFNQGTSLTARLVVDHLAKQKETEQSSDSRD